MLGCGAGLHPGRRTPLAPGLQGRARPAAADHEGQSPEAQLHGRRTGHTILHPNEPGRGPWVHPPGHQVTRIGVPGACHLPTSPSRMLACRALHRPPGTRAEVGGKSTHGPSRALWAQRNGPTSETATRQPRPFHRTWGRAPHGSKPVLPRRLSGLFSPTQLPSAAEPVRGQQSPGAWAWWSPTHCAKRGLRAQPATGLTPMVRGPRRGRWAKSTRGREPRRSARPGPQGAPSHPHRQQVHLLSQICNKK